MQNRMDRNNKQFPHKGYFTSHIYNQCKEAMNEFAMIQPGDKIALEITWDCNTLTMLAVFLEYQKERMHDFSLEFFVKVNDGVVDPMVMKVLENNEITDYHKVASTQKEELYTSIKAAGCNKMALHQNYNHVVKATFMAFMRKKQDIVISPVIHLDDVDITMIRPMYLIKDAHILHWIKKAGVDVSLSDDVTLFGGASLLEEGIDEQGMHSASEIQFNVYERVHE